jgi:hypothetical protein
MEKPKKTVGVYERPAHNKGLRVAMIVVVVVVVIVAAAMILTR